MRPTPEPFDPYATLGVPREADRAEIRRAYRRRARDLHPDATGTDTTSEMARLNRARDEALERVVTGASTRTRRRPAHDATGGSDSAAGAGWAGGAGSADGDGSAEGDAESSREPGYELEWDDYWSAWNDPPRRWRTIRST